MHTTTPYYDYNESDTDAIFMCDRNDDNHLGAQLSLFYFIMFGLSLVGNGLVLIIISRFEKLTVTNIFLLNLVVSDFIFMWSLPFWGIYHQLSTWVFGTSMCKVVGSAYYLGYYSSILFLTLLTFDQHLAVVYPLEAPRLRRQSYAFACCTAVWLLSCLACVKPILLYTVVTDIDEKQFCEEYTNETLTDTINVSVLNACWMHLQLFFFFLFPLAVIVYCYARVTMVVVATRIIAKFRTIRIIFAIVLLFFVCWTPYNVVLLMHNYVGPSTP
ncbi:hypothetical protein CRUP_033064 [Coryphaenoides rupestris]|nr:hypothetical protein CRUP_033064 [Coryphaenoides rupestris]